MEILPIGASDYSPGSFRSTQLRKLSLTGVFVAGAERFMKIDMEDTWYQPDDSADPVMALNLRTGKVVFLPPDMQVRPVHDAKIILET